MEIHPFALKNTEANKVIPEEDFWNGTITSTEEDFYYTNRPYTEQLSRFVANCTRPGLFSYPVKNGNGLGVIVCPGGGYRGLAIDKEGHDIARFLNSIGVTAFVLKYRVPVVNDKRVCAPGPFLDAMKDATRIIRLIRSKANEYGIKKLGLMGFSAGGHLAGIVSTRPDLVQNEDPSLEKFSPRPDFSILIYPVATLTELTHKGSFNALLGENPSQEDILTYSPNEQVNPDTPPCFLAQASDDMVDVHNSIGYFLACREKGVKAELHLYPEGGHGYGIYQRGMSIDTWSQRLQEWLMRLI